MPRPTYILCAESISQDRSTNLFSYFHVLEGWTVSQTPQSDAPPFPAILKFTGVAVWERVGQDDPEQELEYELTIAFPGDDPRKVSAGKFKMHKRYHRFTANFIAPGLPKVVDGNIVFSSKVKSIDSGEWLVQEYRIPIDVVNTQPKQGNESTKPA